MARRVSPRRIPRIAIIMLLVVAATEVAVPFYVEKKVESAVRSGFASAESISVAARAMPALKLLYGHFDRLSIDIEEAVSSGFVIRRISLDSSDARIPLGRFEPGSSRWARALGNSQLEVIIDESNVNDYLGHRDDYLRAFGVRFHPGIAELAGRLFLGGFSVGVESQGHFSIGDGVKLVYVVDKLIVEKSEVPAFIVDMFEDGIAIGIDLSDLPFDIELESVEVGEGMVRLLGRTSEGGSL
ncbi:MAG TPA: DUF2993 domain-containing protein [Bacillota bacterium]|nr:DUF2993 domain-containing protein [Bacillota bacterium]HOL50834.1 DUF2993 domain-containing protein [Bacillota bacterium]